MQYIPGPAVLLHAARHNAYQKRPITRNAARSVCVDRKGALPARAKELAIVARESELEADGAPENHAGPANR